jgi:hypothetical protein
MYGQEKPSVHTGDGKQMRHYRCHKARTSGVPLVIPGLGSMAESDNARRDRAMKDLRGDIMKLRNRQLGKMGKR